MSKKKKVTIDVDIIISRYNIKNREDKINREWVSKNINASYQTLIVWKAGKAGRLAAQALKAEEAGLSLDLFADRKTFEYPKLINQLHRLMLLGDCKLENFVFVE